MGSFSKVSQLACAAGLVVVIIFAAASSIVGCGRPSEGSRIDNGCLLSDGNAALYYNLTIEMQERGPLAQFPPLQPYFGSDGRLVSFDEALKIDNPRGGREAGVAAVSEVTENYLRAQGFAQKSFGDAYQDILRLTSDATVDDAVISYRLAEKLATDERLPDAESIRRYRAGAGMLVNYDVALERTEGDKSSAADNLRRAFGDIYDTNAIPINVLVDTYDQQYRKCAAKSANE
ncbi:hypothetical protein [Antrihabitans stalactiti]|uniref:Uncharacterized protein n=1 Tax=Antrihabitans stalactiti TaxID=2584121 RepID=A0A848KQC5_9NOCA|nr:hypothetical protein [Antrihabitans stalactiti]NMN97817.1 hypothetical protein [Antrihabitans stalactiti]